MSPPSHHLSHVFAISLSPLQPVQAESLNCSSTSQPSPTSLMGNKENLQRRNTVYICSRLNGSNGLELWSLKEFFHYVLSPFPPISTSGVQQGFINLFRTFIQELVEFRRRFRCNISRSNGFLEQSSSIADFLRYR
uniref:Uncharacterized protein LOC101500153 isoform X2 n=1 Tax=Cicer arietinum TaxID=3827 RepID=A0A1S2XG88_CICAR|nr:uncharacterized protein LOC101500153 isoform X2 [Cicer arietinum]